MIVAMFLFAVLSLAVLPLMIGVAEASAGNRTLASANTFANSQIAPIRAAYPTGASATSCAVARTALPRTGFADPAGTGLSADTTVGTCPTAYPGTLAVTVRVYRTDQPTKTLVSLPTLILVAAS